MSASEYSVVITFDKYTFTSRTLTHKESMDVAQEV